MHGAEYHAGQKRRHVEGGAQAGERQQQDHHQQKVIVIRFDAAHQQIEQQRAQSAQHERGDVIDDGQHDVGGAEAALAAQQLGQRGAHAECQQRYGVVQRDDLQHRVNKFALGLVLADGHQR